MISRFFRSFAAQKSPPAAPAPAVPPGVRVYAIGDIHGRADLLSRMHGLIAADRRAAASPESVLVYLGDYIDRGPHSREVVDIAAGPHAMVDRVVRLRGNHEEGMLAFIADVERGRAWLDYGGIATLHSYGVRIPASLTASERFRAMADQLARALPADHRRFYDDLALSETIGDYFFVHAGVNPHVTLDEQDAFDLTTIRAPFIDWGRPLEKVVVHGHTIAPEAEFRPWRFGIDTGAYATGRLTCLVLQGSDQRLLTT